MERQQKEIRNPEQLLREGRTIQIKPQGYSMYPFFVPGRDEAVIEPVQATSQLKRGDVVLYRRSNGILVLHRIWKREGNSFCMVGDNQKEIETGITKEQIKGKLIARKRGGKQLSVKNPIYRAGACLWLWLRPFRPWLSKRVAAAKKRFRFR